MNEIRRYTPRIKPKLQSIEDKFNENGVSMKALEWFWSDDHVINQLNELETGINSIQYDYSVEDLNKLKKISDARFNFIIIYFRYPSQDKYLQVIRNDTRLQNDIKIVGEIFDFFNSNNSTLKTLRDVFSSLGKLIEGFYGEYVQWVYSQNIHLGERRKTYTILVEEILPQIKSKIIVKFLYNEHNFSEDFFMKRVRKEDKDDYAIRLIEEHLKKGKPIDAPMINIEYLYINMIKKILSILEPFQKLLKAISTLHIEIHIGRYNRTLWVGGFKKTKNLKIEYYHRQSKLILFTPIGEPKYNEVVHEFNHLFTKELIECKFDYKAEIVGIYLEGVARLSELILANKSYPVTYQELDFYFLDKKITEKSHSQAYWDLGDPEQFVGYVCALTIFLLYLDKKGVHSDQFIKRNSKNCSILTKKILELLKSNPEIYAQSKHFLNTLRVMGPRLFFRKYFRAQKELTIFPIIGEEEVTF
tara:strand:+ start:306 stop:1724 length:1419 start_codon:yes stop_codon:yes gene_type:complete